MQRRVAPFAALLVAALSACGSPPSATVDAAGDEFSWTVDVSGLDEAMLSTCAGGAAVYGVGGRDDDAFVIEWTGQEWFAPTLPSSAGILWWCWVAADGTVWAVGEHGTVLTRTNGVWSDATPGDVVDDDTTLYGVWGSAPGRVHVVGGRRLGPTTQAVVLAYDESEWIAENPATLPDRMLFKVWGSSDGDVWAVGEGGIILHRQAGQWTAVLSPTDDRLIAVWGSSATDVYAVGGDASGVVLRYDGERWSQLATTPEPLSGVWTAANRPLYVAGNRGYLARYARDGADVIADAPSTALPVDDLCFHALIGAGDAVIATASDLFGGGSTSWRGAVLSHGAAFEGPVTRAVPPDAGAPPIDASVTDALISDAGPIVDAGPLDAAWPGPGELCGMVPAICAAGLECWQLAFESFVFLCTEICSDASECTADYGPGACCERPGFQTLDKVCIPGNYAECTP